MYSDLRVLERILEIEARNRPDLGFITSRKVIWQGSYDVWFNEQDRLDAQRIPVETMKQLEELGLIRSETILYGPRQVSVEIWKITELGMEKLNERKRSVGVEQNPVVDVEGSSI